MELLYDQTGARKGKTRANLWRGKNTMKTKKKRNIRQLPRSLPDIKSAGPIGLKCKAYNQLDYDDYIQFKMQQERKGRFEQHITSCDACFQGLKQAIRLDKEEEHSIPQEELDYHLEGLRDRLDEFYQQDSPLLLAASADDAAAAHADRVGIAHGVAVDPEGKRGFLIQCVASVSPEEVEKGSLAFNAEQVRRLDQKGALYEPTSPCQFVENKLKELFTSNAFFLPFRLSRRQIHVELEHFADEGYLTEAKSLTLTAIVSILSALTGQPCDAPVVFSSRVRQDGALFPGVGHVALKLKAAKEFGIREVVLSTANQNDCPRQYLKDKDFTVRFFSHIGEVLHHLKLFPEEGVRPGDLAPVPWDSGPRSPSWKSLVGIGVKKGIPREVMVNLIEAVEDLCQMRSEMRPISTALVIGDTERIEALLPKSEIHLLPSRKAQPLEGHLNRLATVVDGELTGFVLDKGGEFRSVRKVNIALQGDFKLNPLLSEPAARFAIISAVTEALVFTLDPGGNRIQVFSDGELVCRYLNGGWHVHDLLSLHRTLADVAATKGYDQKVMERMGRTAVCLSYLHLGGLLVVVPEGTRFEDKIEDCLKQMGIRMNPRPLSDLSDPELIKFAKEDGAVLVDAKGMLQTFMAYLKPAAVTPVDADPGVGARHLSAQRFSAQVQCLTLVISEDGAITVYSDGKKLYRL